MKVKDDRQRDCFHGCLTIFAFPPTLNSCLFLILFLIVLFLCILSFQFPFFFFSSYLPPTPLLFPIPLPFPLPLPLLPVRSVSSIHSVYSLRSRSLPRFPPPSHSPRVLSPNDYGIKLFFLLGWTRWEETRYAKMLISRIRGWVFCNKHKQSD